MLAKEWPYVAGAVILAFLNIGYLAITGHAWGITSAITDAGLHMIGFLGVDISQLPYYQDFTAGRLETDPYWETGWSILGIGGGATLSALAGNELRFKKIRSYKQIGFAITGGIFMGFGSRLAFGCNIGTLLNGIASQSLHGWIFLLGLIVGTLLAIPIFKKYMA